MLVAESRMVMGKAHVFHVGSLRFLSEIKIEDDIAFKK